MSAPAQKKSSEDQAALAAQIALVRNVSQTLINRLTTSQGQGSGAHAQNPSRNPQGSDKLAVTTGTKRSQPDGDQAPTRKRAAAAQPESMESKMMKIEKGHFEIHKKMDETIAHQRQILEKLAGFHDAARDCNEKKEDVKDEEEDDEDEEEEEEEEKKADK